jgi:uncharacterized protein DUF3302
MCSYLEFYEDFAGFHIHQLCTRATPLIDDPTLNYCALGILLFVIATLFYTIIIATHDIPDLLAKSGRHSHGDAAHAAEGVGLFTLHGLLGHLRRGH